MTASPDATIRVWNVPTSQTTQIIRAHDQAVTGLSLHPTGDYVLSTSVDQHWAFSDIRTGRLITKVIKWKFKLYSVPQKKFFEWISYSSLNHFLLATGHKKIKKKKPDRENATFHHKRGIFHLTSFVASIIIFYLYMLYLYLFIYFNLIGYWSTSF